MVDISFLILSLVALVAGLLATKGMILLNVLDVPNHRSSHHVPTPRIGGVGIIVGVLTFVAGHYLIYSQSLNHIVMLVLVSSLVMAGKGLADDLFNVNFKIRLVVQLLVSSIVVLMGLKLRSLAFPYFGEVIFSPSISFVLSVLWLVAFTNAFNFIDGLNGLSSMGVIVACVFVVLIFNNPISLLMLALGLGTLGFLRYNFGKAKIFLSDVGSQFIGFFMASCALALPYFATDAAYLVIPFIFFFYIFDAFVTVIRRLINGENIFEPHRSHLFQLLNRMGWSHTKVALFYGGVSTIAGLVAIKMVTYESYMQMYFFLGFLIICMVYWIIVMKEAAQKSIKL